MARWPELKCRVRHVYRQARHTDRWPVPHVGAHLRLCRRRRNGTPSPPPFLTITTFSRLLPERTLGCARAHFIRRLLPREFREYRDTKRFPPAPPIPPASSRAICRQAARESKQRQRKRSRKERVLPSTARFAV